MRELRKRMKRQDERKEWVQSMREENEGAEKESEKVGWEERMSTEHERREWERWEREWKGRMRRENEYREWENWMIDATGLDEGREGTRREKRSWKENENEKAEWGGWEKMKKENEKKAGWEERIKWRGEKLGKETEKAGWVSQLEWKKRVGSFVARMWGEENYCTQWGYSVSRRDGENAVCQAEKWKENESFDQGCKEKRENEPLKKRMKEEKRRG
jgi:hypothetical protein